MIQKHQHFFAEKLQDFWPMMMLVINPGGLGRFSWKRGKIKLYQAAFVQDHFVEETWHDFDASESNCQAMAMFERAEQEYKEFRHDLGVSENVQP